MATKKSRRSTRKPGQSHGPRESLTYSGPDVQWIIQKNIIQFVSAVSSLRRVQPPDWSSQMGRRFPEFCILRAACRVSVRVSRVTGNDRVASYQAAIDSVAGRHYADWPFMVEVLNKWLEMNQDFVRDPLGHAASNPSPAPAPGIGNDHSAISTIQATPVQFITSTVPTTVRLLTQSPPPGADDMDLPPSSDAPEHIPDPSPVASETGSDDPLSSLNERQDISAPIQKIFPLSWIGAFSLLALPGAGYVSRNLSSASCGWLTTLEPSTQQIPSSPETGRFGFAIFSRFCEGCWNILRKPFASMSG